MNRKISNPGPQSSRTTINWIACLAFASVLVPATAYAAKVARVFVDSEASLSYDERKNGESGAKYETYAFMKGNFYGGSFSDKSLRTPSFDEIIGTLAENMKERNYYPAADAMKSDLLIIVHYGTTSVQQDLEELFLIDPTDPYAEQSDPDGFSEVYNDLHDEIDDLDYIARERVAQHQGSMDNSRLGIGKALDRKNINKTEEFDLRVELEDERYFIILMAYDFHKIRENNERELLWTTRFSVPAVGTNFMDAYPALARAGKEYYGTSLEKYAKTSTHFGTGSVDIGTLETVGVEEDADSEKSEK